MTEARLAAEAKAAEEERLEMVEEARRVVVSKAAKISEISAANQAAVSTRTHSKCSAHTRTNAPHTRPQKPANTHTHDLRHDLRRERS